MSEEEQEGTREEQSTRMVVHYHEGDPVGCTCNRCGHEFPVDPCTEENLVGRRRLLPDGSSTRYNVTRCPKCGKVDDEYADAVSIDEVPEALRYYSLDEVAETVSGISYATYMELWHLLGQAEEAGTAKPLGGDGSGNTIEEPVITSGEYGSDLCAAWHLLSEASRVDIWEAVKHARQ